MQDGMHASSMVIKRKNSSQKAVLGIPYCRHDSICQVVANEQAQICRNEDRR